MWVSVRVCLLYPLFTNMHKKRETANVVVNFACAEITKTTTTTTTTNQKSNKAKQKKTTATHHFHFGDFCRKIKRFEEESQNLCSA